MPRRDARPGWEVVRDPSEGTVFLLFDPKRYGAVNTEGFIVMAPTLWKRGPFADRDEATMWAQEYLGDA